MSPRPVQLRGTGSLILRLQDIDLEDVFKVLHHETGEGFVVSGAVSGRVGIDLDRVTRGEALAALGSLGVTARPAGAVRIVDEKMEGDASHAPATPGGDLEPISMSLKRWSLEDLAALLGAVEGRSVDVPEGDLGHASVFAADIPRDELFTAVFEAAGLALRLDNGRIIVGRHDAAGRAQHRRLPDWRDPATPRSIADAPLAAVWLVGLSRSAREWTAWVYTDDRRACWALKAGQRLWDGEVKRIEADHVLFEGVRESISEPRQRFRARLTLSPRPR